MFLSAVTPFWFWEVTFLNKWGFRNIFLEGFLATQPKSGSIRNYWWVRRTGKRPQPKCTTLAWHLKRTRIEESSRTGETVRLCRTELESMHVWGLRGKAISKPEILKEYLNRLFLHRGHGGGRRMTTLRGKGTEGRWGKGLVSLSFIPSLKWCSNNHQDGADVLVQPVTLKGITPPVG